MLQSRKIANSHAKSALSETDKKDKNMMTAIVFSVLGLINTAVYTVLMCLDIVPFFMTKGFAVLMFVCYFAAIWAPMIAEKIFKAHFDTLFIIAFDIYIVMGILVGTLWEVYKISLVYDKIVHFTSGVLFAILAYSLFTSGKENKLSAGWQFVLIFSFAMAVGGIWEIIEFTFDSLFAQNSQSWMGFEGHEVLKDTMIDLICDCVGGLTGSVSILLSERSKKKRCSPKLDQVNDDLICPEPELQQNY